MTSRFDAESYVRGGCACPECNYALEGWGGDDHWRWDEGDEDCPLCGWSHADEDERAADEAADVRSCYETEQSLRPSFHR